MRRNYRRASAAIAVAGLLLAGCGDGQDPGEQAATEPPTDQPATDGATPSDGAIGDPDLADPNEDVVDGVYRGLGVVVPVPEGWSLDPRAFAAGTVAAVSEDGTQQMTARAIDTEEAEAAGEPLDMETMLDDVRQQAGQESDVDEEVDVSGADRAHRLSFLALPPPQEGLPGISVTIVVAESDEDVIAQFAYSATDEDYDQDTVALLLDGAGIDHDSEPPPIPRPQQQPQPRSSPTPR